MLVLATLHRLLSQVISSPGLHTAALLTPNGQLVSYACDSTRSKDDVRLVVGLSSEIWLEVADQGIGMVDSEVGTAHHGCRIFSSDIKSHRLAWAHPRHGCPRCRREDPHQRRSVAYEQCQHRQCVQ